MAKEFSVIGKSIIREDAFEKVSGKAKFADDYKYDGMLFAKMIRINSTHAKINSIDFSDIENEKDILIVTSKDVQGKNVVGLIKHDQPIFCDEKIVTPGDVVAMLVGDDEEKLNALIKKVKVDFTPLPTLTDATKALDKDAILIHPELKSNLIIHHPLRKGDVEKGFAESDEILEQTYTTQLIEHAYIEPECVIAIPKEDGIKIIGSIQNPFTARRIVSLATNLPLEKIEVIQAQLGGSFGGKDDIMCILSSRAAVASLISKRPVKIKYTREESILESYKRHPYILNYKVGYTKDGKIKAMKIDILADAGAYCSMSPFVTWRTVVQATGPYEIENVHTDVRAVYTNNPYTGAMRGFGSPQPIFAQESIMDEIAVRVGLTPDEIRRINGFKNGSITATGQKLQNHDVNLITVLNKAVSLTNFTNKWKEYNKEKPILNNYEFEKPILEKNKFIEPKKLLQKGIGLAVSFRGCSLGAEGLDETYCYMSIEKNGKVNMISGLAENGQGLRTTLVITAAETLGITPEKINYLETNTTLIKDSGPTVASRGTIMGTGSVQNAGEILKERLEKIVREKFQLDENDFVSFRENLVFSRRKGLLTNFDFVCQLAFEQKENLSAIGYYKSPKVDWNEHNGQGDAYFTYVYGCQIAEVTVNIGTGEVYLNKITAVHDPGTVINRLGALGQVFGGVTQGAGYGLFEEITQEDGMIRELNFDQYLIPTAKDVDEIKPFFVEGNDIYGGYGAKSLGEPTLELTAAAIANAIKNATGKRFFNLPINLEEIILGKKIRPQNLNRGSL
ncbi:xanthine dehydrogenase family protein molybdopterin-binding subunit [Stygiobacter electus]|uniref:Xanthine dehydrogenase family protein molybdopterin-binding subunit n=1 Tax=Stygiobacter electus TaxID=3032292 RepID=A0AAE3TEW5_9BACT|nr:xanthine dehydrogenase family protein molybdopterin-binding subunit [Stygiobacter electus]MDF1612797.1 xanthine dehydrogenase family protein molybdopterin-binding subunit [Stygiobacter electus]